MRYPPGLSGAGCTTPDVSMSPDFDSLNDTTKKHRARATPGKAPDTFVDDCSNAC